MTTNRSEGVGRPLKASITAAMAPADGTGIASRDDPTTGIREVAEFIGTDGDRMFGCRHLPDGRPAGGLVVCSPLQAEFVRNYRREVVLARRLAARGIAVLRFHYRGTGNSYGEGTDVTFDSMVDDTIGAAEWIKESEGIDSLAFLGTRWGGLVADAAAAGFDGAPLMLWEPVVDGKRYFREIFRALRMHELKEGAAGSTAPAPEDFLHAESVDVLGYSIDRALYESALDRTIAKAPSDTSRRILLLQFGTRGVLRPEYRDLVNRLKGLGIGIDARHARWSEEAWWFSGGRTYEEEQSLTADIVNITEDWLVPLFRQGGTG